MITGYFISFLHKVEKLAKKMEFFFLLSFKKITKVKIIEAGEEGVRITVFKEHAKEHVEMPDVYNFIDSCSFDVDLPEISLWKYNNAFIFANSDFVLTEGNHAVWPKYFAFNYSKNITSDRYLYKEEEGYVYYKKAKKQIELDNVFSLIGVHSNVWAHAISEYFPKLDVLQNAIDDCPGKITVVVPIYKDVQLHTIMMDFIKKYNVNILEVDNETSVLAKTLYFIQRPTYFTDNEVGIAIGDDLHPKIVADILKKNLVFPYSEKIEEDDKYRRIFLPRRGGLGKGLTNGMEIEQYFKERGFLFIEPHKVTIEEKIRIFKSAEIIVGPAGSAMTNLIFCKPGTKVLIFANYYSLFESYLCMHKQYFPCDYTT